MVRDERVVEHSGFRTKFNPISGMPIRTKYCWRTKCDNDIRVFKDSFDKYIIDASAFVISFSGGFTRRIFCSDKCAVLWLQQKNRE